MQRAESSGGGSSGLQRADSSDFVTAEQLAASTGLAMNGAIELPQRKKEKAPSPCCGCVGIFHSKRFPCYYLCVMFIQLLMLLAMWIVQIEVDTGPWLSLVLMIGGIMIGMQVSQASTHWLAATDESDESDDEWRTSTAPWAIMARVQRNQWHTHMIFYPILIMILMALAFNIGTYTMLLYYTGDEGRCASGFMEGYRMLSKSTLTSTLAKATMVAQAALFVFAIASLSLLSLTHFRAYTLLQEHSPDSAAEGDDEIADVGFFKAKYIRRTYTVSIVAQGLNILVLSVAREHAPEPGVLHSMLLLGLFVLGWQVGVGERHLHYKFEASISDPAVLRDRVEWHASMLFYPCVVCVFQCFYFFSAIFTLLPFFSTTDCKARTIFAVVTQLKPVGQQILVANSVLFFIAVVSLVHLAFVHFVQFCRYQRMQQS